MPPLATTVVELDEQRTWCLSEAASLRRMQARAGWSAAKIAMFEAIAETLRQVRQDKQMEGINGTRIRE